jgi:hypothetical protein
MRNVPLNGHGASSPGPYDVPPLVSVSWLTSCPAKKLPPDVFENPVGVLNWIPNSFHLQWTTDSRSLAGVRAQRGAHPIPRRNGPIPYLLLGQCDVDCQTDSSDIVLCLAGVNEHAVLRIVGTKRWSVAHFLRTIQYLFELPSSFLSNLMLRTSCEGLRRRKERNCTSCLQTTCL